jgi:hypothetical protein
MVPGLLVVLYRECSLHSAVLLLVRREHQNSDALSSHPCSGRACHPGVEGLAIDGGLQFHGRRVVQGGHGEASRFALRISWAMRSDGSELSSDSSVFIESHLVCASPARIEPAREYLAVTVMRTFFGSMCSARVTCTSCVASQNPTATVK